MLCGVTGVGKSTVVSQVSVDPVKLEPGDRDDWLRSDPTRFRVPTSSGATVVVAVEEMVPAVGANARGYDEIFGQTRRYAPYCYVMMYDVTDRSTFDRLDALMASEEEGSRDMPSKEWPRDLWVVVGNKADLLHGDRQVSIAEGQAKADSLGVSFFEMSAATGAGVEDVILHVARKAVEAWEVELAIALPAKLAKEEEEQRRKKEAKEARRCKLCFSI
jgi:hypothetical protein